MVEFAVASMIAAELIKVLETNPEISKDVKLMTNVIGNLERMMAPQLKEELKQFFMDEGEKACMCLAKKVTQSCVPSKKKTQKAMDKRVATVMKSPDKPDSPKPKMPMADAIAASAAAALSANQSEAPAVSTVDAAATAADVVASTAAASNNQ